MAVLFVTATNTGTLVTTVGIDIAVGNFDSTIAEVTTANTGTLVTTVGIDIAASNCDSTIAGVTAANTGTLVTTVGGKFTVVIIVCYGQSTAVIGLIMLQTGMVISARQSIITIQLDVRVAFAGNAYSGSACFAGVDIDVIQRDIHRLAFPCIDRYCIRRRVRRAVAFNNRVRVILSCCTILGDIVAVCTSRNRDVTIFNEPCIRKGGERHPDHEGGGEGEGGGALCGGAAAGRFGRRNRAVSQNTHGELAIRDHK